MIDLIDPKINEEINLKKEKLAGNSNQKSGRDIILKDIRSIGDVYSFWIENPQLRKSMLIGGKSPKTIRKEARKGIEAVSNGWYFLSQKSEGADFIDNLDIDLLKQLNGIILPGFGGNSRNEIDMGLPGKGFEVTLNYKGYRVPKAKDVPQKLANALSRIREIYHNVNPINSAIASHLELAAVQPFPDGNKRVARLIQDKILSDGGLPPSVINAGEAGFYRNLLGKTLLAYSGGNKDGMREFYDYCASKVNNSLDELLGDLEEQSGNVFN